MILTRKKYPVKYVEISHPSFPGGKVRVLDVGREIKREDTDSSYQLMPDGTVEVITTESKHNTLRTKGFRTS